MFIDPHHLAWWCYSNYVEKSNGKTIAKWSIQYYFATEQIV
jgi:hypothetical protein